MIVLLFPTGFVCSVMTRNETKRNSIFGFVVRTTEVFDEMTKEKEDKSRLSVFFSDNSFAGKVSKRNDISKKKDQP